MSCGISVISERTSAAGRPEAELRESLARLARSERGPELVRQLLYAAEFRGVEMGPHLERMSRYCELLGRRLGLDDERRELIRTASLLHDIGKIGIPDRILLKPGSLSAQERRLMEQHAEIGYRMLTGSRSELLALAATIAWTHHERFDGTGYPRGLAREAIPLEGRIASVADVFDALTSERVYRPAFSLEEALETMKDGRATHFDPSILDLFLASLPEVVAIKEKYGPDVSGGELGLAPVDVLATLPWPGVAVGVA